MARNSSSTGNGTDTTTGTTTGTTIPDATTAPAAGGGGTLPWFEIDTTLKPPPMDLGRAMAYRSALLGGGRQLGLATTVDEKIKAVLDIARRDFNENVNQELLNAWAQNPKLIPPGTNFADLKQQIADCNLSEGRRRRIAAPCWTGSSSPG